MINAGEPAVVDTDLCAQLHYIAGDDRGIELHVIAVPDNRCAGGLAVIHAVPTSYPSDTDEHDDTSGQDSAEQEGGPQ
ncbi:MAG: hypothetical protein ACR2LF_13570 [Jatrophihabitantaceae bacterium]